MAIKNETLVESSMDPELALQALAAIQNLHPTKEELKNPIKFLLDSESPAVLARIVDGLGRPRPDLLADKVIMDLVGPEIFEAALLSDTRQTTLRHVLHLYSRNHVTQQPLNGVFFHLDEDYSLDLSRKISASYDGESVKSAGDGSVIGDPKVLFKALSYSAAQLEYAIIQEYPMPVARLAEELAV